MSVNFKNSQRREPNLDSLWELERELKEKWSQYIRHVDQNGLDETAKALKSRYYQLYQHYQRNKNWRKAMISN